MSNKNKAKTDSRKAYGSNYKAAKTWAANRKRKLTRTAKAQPKNEQVRLALLDINYRRKTPKAPFWSASMIATAKLYKEFAGKFDKDIFSPDIKKQVAASQVRAEPLPVSKKRKQAQGKEPGMFSIEARLINGRKGASWSM